MSLNFCRYSATGNTFLIFDNRDGELSKHTKDVYAKWCTNHQVDGLLFVETPKKETLDFHMRYLNADGGEVEMCGNGARSILHFVSQELSLAPKGDRYQFSTQKGLYYGKGSTGFPVQMTEIYDWNAIEVEDLFESEFSYYLNTGVPHVIYQIDDVAKVDLQEVGARIRYDKRFEKGTNVNFFEVLSNSKLKMRTYERGVEGETLSCGTGATAVALSVARLKKWSSPIIVAVPGGELTISFNDQFSEVFLEGPVELVARDSIK